MKINAPSAFCLSVMLAASTLPASAQTRRVGAYDSRGGQAVRETTVSPDKAAVLTLLVRERRSALLGIALDGRVMERRTIIGRMGIGVIAPQPLTGTPTKALLRTEEQP